MEFKELDKRKTSELEKEISKRWKENNIYGKFPCFSAVAEFFQVS